MWKLQRPIILNTEWSNGFQWRENVRSRRSGRDRLTGTELGLIGEIGCGGLLHRRVSVFNNTVFQSSWKRGF